MLSQIVKYSFLVEELQLQASDFLNLLGPENSMMPEVSDTIENFLNNNWGGDEIQGGYAIYNTKLIMNERQVLIQDTAFDVGKSIFHYLKGSDKIAVFACTAGKNISEKAKQLMNNGNLVEGYTFDIIGSVVVEKAMDLIQKKLTNEMQACQVAVSNRYSPGYCGWDVKEQHKLFSFLPNKVFGIELNDSALMKPVKSVSGFMGLGNSVKYRDYSCNQCNSVNCIYRGTKIA